jgi:uroporphyrin-III C-methyltransferase / precorrin-2 dehydrogenase / sirohydrochlorin ferrochelatase
MRHFPVFLDLRDRACLVIGATDEARRKAQVLREAGAIVTAIDDISAWPAAPHALAVIATGDLDRDTEAAQLLKLSTALLNVVDRPSLCSFVWPAIVERGPVIIAISTSGTSPTLAKLIRQRIERAVPVAVGELARLAGRLRRSIASAVPTIRGRRQFWQHALEGRAGALAFANRSADAQAALRDDVRLARSRALPDLNADDR